MKIIANIYFRTFTIPSLSPKGGYASDEDEFYEKVENDRVRVEVLSHNGYVMPAFQVNKSSK